MTITPHQSHVLNNLHRIVMRRMANGGFSPHLDGKDCHLQINALAAKKLIVLHRGNDRIADPVGFGCRWGTVAT